MKILRLIFGAGIIIITVRIGLRIKPLFTGILLIIGLVLFLTSFKKVKK